MISLGRAVRLAINAEGERAYPDECCGVMLGSIGEAGDRRVTAIIGVENAREDGERYHRFVIEPEDFMRAEAEARRMGLDVLGFYHSHPDHPAEPSDYDREHAMPFYSYVIVSVEEGTASELTSWELAADRSEFFRMSCGE